MVVPYAHSKGIPSTEAMQSEPEQPSKSGRTIETGACSVFLFG